MIELKDIKDFTDVLEFTNGYSFFKKDNKARAVLNKTLETNYKFVYRWNRKMSEPWKENNIDWSGEEFYVVTERNKILRFGNSEWAFFGTEK